MTSSDFDSAASLKLHDAFGRVEDEFNAMLDESLSPRGPGMLFDIVAGLGLPPGANAVDIGCGEGNHTIELAKRFRLSVLGIDPLERHLAIARNAVSSEAAAQPGIEQLVRFSPGLVERLPVDEDSTDLVWCRDVLSLVENLPAAYHEIRRVLKPGGRAVIYQMCTTALLEPSEAAFLLPTMGCIAESMYPEVIEASIANAGLRIDQCHILGTEWGENGQEQTGRGATKLIRAARLLRAPQRYIDRFGKDNYNIALGDNLWHVYRLIGKLSGHVYVLSAPGSGELQPRAV